MPASRRSGWGGLVDRAGRREFPPGAGRGAAPALRRLPARLLVFDTLRGKEVARLDLHGDCDDLGHDVVRHRIYASCGEGFIDVFVPTNAAEIKRVESVRTETGARTCQGTGEFLYLAVPRRGDRPAEIRCYRLGP